MTQGFFPDIAKSVSDRFLYEIGKGNVPGHSLRTIVMRNPSATAAEEHVWGGGGDMTFPTAAETWEIFSTNVNDTIAGSGARLVLVNSLDINYNPQIEIVALNGGVAPLVNSHFRPDDVIVISSGASRRNEGDLIVRVAGAGATRRVVPATFSASQDSHFTVPAGVTGISRKTVFAFPSGNSGEAVGKFIILGTNTEITSGKFPFFQNIDEFDLAGEFALPEKTDTFFTANSTPPGATVNIVLVLVLIENEFL